MTDEKNNSPRSQFSMNSFPEPKQFREQSEQLAKDAPLADLDTMTCEEMRQLIYEMQIKQIETGLEIKQLRNRLEEKDDQAALFSILTENMLDMVALTDMEGNFIFAGKSHEILGYEPGFLIGKNVMDFVHPEDLPRIKEAFVESLASGHSRRAEYRYRCRDGSYLWLETVGNFYRDKDGIPQKIVFSSRDITDPKKVEEELYKSEAMTQALLNGIPESAFLIESDGTILAANATVAQRLNYPIGELIGSNLFTRVSTEVAEFRRKFLDQVLQTGKPFQFEDVRSGRDIENRINPILDQDGKVTRLAIVGIDITERKRAEKSLRESRDLLDTTQRLAKIGGWEWDVGRQTMSWTDETYHIHGFEPGEVAAGSPEHIQRSLACYDPDDRLVIEAAFRRCAEEGKPYDLDVPFTTAHGHRKWVKTIAKAVMEENHIVKVTGNIMDITERKWAEKALQESEERFQKMLSLVPDMISIQDTDMNIIYSNWNGVGAVSEEKRVLNTKCYRTYRGYDNICPDCQARTVMETGKSFQEESKLSDGRWVDLRVFSILDKNGAVELFAEWVRDITDQKHIEEELRKSEKEHRRLFETMDQGVVYQDTNGQIISANPAAERILGLSFEQMRGKTSINLRWRMIKEDGTEVPGKDHPAIIALRTGETVGPVIRGVFHPERSTYIWLAITVVPLFQQGETKPFQVYATFEDVTEHKQAVEELKEREAFIKATLDNLPVGVAVNSVDPEVSFTYMNDNFAIFYRTTREALDAPNDFWEVVYKDPIFREQIKKRVLEDCASNDPERMYWEDIPVLRPGKKPFYITAKNIPLPENNLMVSTVWDVTNRKRAEDEREKLQKQLAQAQKMESVGRLAGGVAHDFNNKLSIINGYAEIAMETIDPSDPLLENIREIQIAGQQSAAIVRQLLAFARQQTISPVQLDLNDTISSMLKMLQRLIGEDVHLEWHPGSNLWPVKIDPSQVDQILANLAVNSRDAISDVGNLTIETDNIVVDEDYYRGNPETIPGRYVMLAVSDNGCGMEKEVQDKIFEPFYTTKEIGKGTGLGLPTIYGIVKQNNGFINVYSEPGDGTTFKLYFPSHEEAASSLHSAKESTGQILTGTETVLVVEDEKTILQMSKQMLERLGYTVETAGSPSEALQIAEEYDGAIDILITDVIMPEMNGRDLSSQLLKSHPSLKTLYMSGYTANVIAHHGVLDEGLQFIQKPFSLKDLAVKVREVLERE